MFYGRKDQIARFSALWSKSVPSLVVCRGRRRIGKSTLIREFARQSGGLYLKIEGLAPDGYMTNAKQLGAFREQLAAQTGRAVPRLKDWSQAFAALNEALDGAERKVVLLDEVSWMGGYDHTFPARLKVAWDNLFHDRANLVFFVCGSVSTWIHQNILRSRGFVGRITLDTVVEELPLADCLKFWGGRVRRLDTRDVLDVLSVTGGVPRYLEEIDPSLSADENVRRLCFLPDGYLYREFNELFNDIVSRTATTKRRVLEALAEGPLSGTELAERLALPRNGRLSELLEELETAGFVAKADGVNPATGKRGRVDRYRLRGFRSICSSRRSGRPVSSRSSAGPSSGWTSRTRSRARRRGCPCVPASPRGRRLSTTGALRRRWRPRTRSTALSRPATCWGLGGRNSGAF